MKTIWVWDFKEKKKEGERNESVKGKYLLENLN